jgi:DNA-binding Lrp family transcriptional regulator
LFLDKIDECLLSELSCGLSLTEQPFSGVAVKLGISLEEVLARLANLKREGVIRRFGVTLKPNNIGFIANAVVVWNVPAERVNEVGLYFSSFREVSHCYERSPVLGLWDYNMYTVLHAQDRTVIERMVNLLAETVGVSDYLIVYSKRDLKNSVNKERQV